MNDAPLETFGRRLAAGIRWPDVAAQFLDDGQQLCVLGLLVPGALPWYHARKVGTARAVTACLLWRPGLALPGRVCGSGVFVHDLNRLEQPLVEHLMDGGSPLPVAACKRPFQMLGWYGSAT